MRDNSAVTVTTYHSREDQPFKKDLQYSSRKQGWQCKGEIPAPSCFTGMHTLQSFLNGMVIINLSKNITRSLSHGGSISAISEYNSPSYSVALHGSHLHCTHMICILPYLHMYSILSPCLVAQNYVDQVVPPGHLDIVCLRHSNHSTSCRNS